MAAPTVILALSFPGTAIPARTLAPLPVAAVASIPTPVVVKTPGVYGPGIVADALANTRIGYGGFKSSYRFRATESGTLVSARVYLTDGVGYAAGTGGTLRMTLQADDGSGMPHATVLATAGDVSPGNPLPSNPFFTFTFASPPTLVGGVLYHLVFTNVDPAPTVNYVSLDVMWYRGTSNDPRQPKYADADWAQTLYDGSWALRTDASNPPGNYAPILQMVHGSGNRSGMGYMESSIFADLLVISGNEMVRQTFPVATYDRTVTGFGFRLSRKSGTDALSVRLETAAGVEVETVSVAAAGIAIDSGSTHGLGTATLVTGSFLSSHVLTAGVTYHLRLSCAGTTIYRTWTIRRGVSAAYGFVAPTWYGGNAQKTSNGSSWSSAGRSPGEEECQCYLVTAAA
jgi:hypothetical protein